MAILSSLEVSRMKVWRVDWESCESGISGELDLSCESRLSREESSGLKISRKGST